MKNLAIVAGGAAGAALCAGIAHYSFGGRDDAASIIVVIFSATLGLLVGGLISALIIDRES